MSQNCFFRKHCKEFCGDSEQNTPFFWSSRYLCVGTHKNKICEDYDEYVSRDMLHLGFPTIFSRTENQNSRI